jgi:cysteine synthase B
MRSLTTYFPEPSLIQQIYALDQRVGHTPIVQITKLFHKKNVSLYAKKEWVQLSGSIKARAAYNIIRRAIETGELTRSKILLDATSGNTGIAYATIAGLLNIPVTLCLPENASQKRKDILESLGANLILTSRFEGTDGAQQRAKEISIQDPTKFYYADQYRNDNNWKAHYLSTAPEIIEALPGITHFVVGLGTTGTFTGSGRKLKRYNPNIKLVSLQPDTAMHGLEGWKHLDTALVPAIYDPSLADDNMEISTEDAMEIIPAAMKHEGLFLSPSSAANLAGAIRVAEKLEEGIVVTVLPDNGDKYGKY